MNGAWTPSFYGYDGGGNVRQLTNSAGPSPTPTSTMPSATLHHDRLHAEHLSLPG